jgi:Na+/proline symporter
VYASRLGSLIEVVNLFGSFFYGSLLGVFVLAIGTRWATPRSAFAGLLAGMGAVAFFGMTTEFSFLWYNLVGVATVVAVGFLVSLGERFYPSRKAS